MRCAGQHCSSAPDQNPQNDKESPGDAITQVAEEGRGEKIADHESGEEPPRVPVAHAEFGGHGGADGVQHIPVQVIEEVEPCKDAQEPERRGLFHKTPPEGQKKALHL